MATVNGARRTLTSSNLRNLDLNKQDAFQGH